MENSHFLTKNYRSKIFLFYKSRPPPPPQTLYPSLLQTTTRVALQSATKKSAAQATMREVVEEVVEMYVCMKRTHSIVGTHTEARHTHAHALQFMWISQLFFWFLLSSSCTIRAKVHTHASTHVRTQNTQRVQAYDRVEDIQWPVLFVWKKLVFAQKYECDTFFMSAAEHIYKSTPLLRFFAEEYR